MRVVDISHLSGVPQDLVVTKVINSDLGDGRARAGSAWTSSSSSWTSSTSTPPPAIQDLLPQRHPRRHLRPRTAPQPDALRGAAVPQQGRRRGSRQRRHQPLRPHRRRGADQLQLPLLLRHHPRGAAPARERPPPPAPRPLRRPGLRHASRARWSSWASRARTSSASAARDAASSVLAVMRSLIKTASPRPYRHPHRHRRCPGGAGLRGPRRRAGRPPHRPRRRRPLQELPLEPQASRPYLVRPPRRLEDPLRPGSDERLGAFAEQ